MSIGAVVVSLVVAGTLAAILWFNRRTPRGAPVPVEVERPRSKDHDA